MKKLCPKCGYKGEFSGINELAACPNCGAIYEKVMRYLASLPAEERKNYLSLQKDKEMWSWIGNHTDKTIAKALILDDFPFIDESGNINGKYISTQIEKFYKEERRKSDIAGKPSFALPSKDYRFYSDCVWTLIADKYQLDDIGKRDLKEACDKARLETRQKHLEESKQELEEQKKKLAETEKLAATVHKRHAEGMRKRAEQKLILDQTKDPDHLKPGFHATQQVVAPLLWSNKPSRRSGIALNEDDKLVCIKAGPHEGIFDYKDILACELYENGDTVTSTSRSSQLAGMAIGGLALGGLGALVGGLSGKQRSAQKVDHIEVVITVNNPDNPLFNIYFLNHETKRKGMMHQIALDKARRCVALATLAMKAADEMDRESSANSLPTTVEGGVREISIADELLKLDDLRSRGVLSEEEFRIQKTRLLSEQ